MYSCPICRKPIEKQYDEIKGGSIVSCENRCFELKKDIYASCPICGKGKLSKNCFHGSQYKKCDNPNCEFEINVDSLITLILNKIEIK